MQITKIERASRNKPLYHVYSGETLIFTVTEETLLHFLLAKGKELSDARLNEIYHFDQVQRCVQQALRYLSRRGHFALELKRKLQAKGYETEIIEEAISYLRQKKYLDDAQLTAQFVHDGIQLKKYGPLLLKKKLLEKGAAREFVESYLQQAYPPEKQEAQARALLRKKLRSLPEHLPVTKRRQKIAAFLQQRGFGWEIIRPLLDELLTE